jgi:tetratricopeptide (TPR) repeat protein
MNQLTSPQRAVLVLGIIFCATASSNALAASRPDTTAEAILAQELWKAVPMVAKLQVSTKLGKKEKPGRSAYASETLDEIAVALARLGRLSTALQVLKIRNRSADAGEGAYTQAEVFQFAARRRVALGDLEGAKALIPSIRMTSSRADVWEATARAYLRRGDKKSAHLALLHVPVLVQVDAVDLSRTAYLFAQCGDIAAAKRLFAFSRDPDSPDASRILQPSVLGPDLTLDSERLQYANFLLKSGFKNEWIAYDSKYHFPLNEQLRDLLVKQGWFDQALAKARQLSDDVEQVKNVVLLTLARLEQQGNRAAAVQALQEAEAISRSMPQPEPSDPAPSDSPGEESYYRARIRESHKFLALGYRALGDDLTADRWLALATADTKPEDSALIQVNIEALRFIYSQNNPGYLSFGREQRKASQAVISEASPLLVDVEAGFFWLRKIVAAQIQAGEYEAAPTNLPTLERLALAGVIESGSGRLSDVVEVATCWRQCHQEARAQKLLLKVLNIRQASGLSLHQVAFLFAEHGFIEECRELLALQPHPKPEDYMGSGLVYSYAKYQPGKVPSWIMQMKAPHQRLQALIDFVSASTRPYIETDDDEATLMTGGSMLPV